MFTGIIRHIGKLYQLQIASQNEPGQIQVECPLFREGTVAEGDSIAVNGVCLTVTRLCEQIAVFDLASETVRRTTLSGLVVGSGLNIEPSLRFGDKVDGHLVQGHVDAVSEVLELHSESGTLNVKLSLPKGIQQFVVTKGSVCLDGVSLTVGEVTDESFNVYLIPYTIAQTNFKSLFPGQLVNVEADCMARYAESLIRPYLRGKNETR